MTERTGRPGHNGQDMTARTGLCENVKEKDIWQIFSEIQPSKNVVATALSNKDFKALRER